MSLKRFLTKHVYNVVRTTTTKKVLLLQTSPLRRRNGASIFLWHYERNYRVQNNCANYCHHVLYVSEGSNHVTATWKKDFFPLFVCLLVCFFLLLLLFWFFLPSAFLVFFLLLLLLSAFYFHPHPPSVGIQSPFYRHPFSTRKLFQIRACMIGARKAKHLDATTMFTYPHANTPVGQSERVHYLSYFIKGFPQYFQMDLQARDKVVFPETSSDFPALLHPFAMCRFPILSSGCKGLPAR